MHRRISSISFIANLLFYITTTHSFPSPPLSTNETYNVTALDRRAFPSLKLPSLNSLPCRSNTNPRNRPASCTSLLASAGLLDSKSEYYDGWDLAALSRPPGVMTAFDQMPYVYDASLGAGVTIYLW